MLYVGRYSKAINYEPYCKVATIETGRVLKRHYGIILIECKPSILNVIYLRNCRH